MARAYISRASRSYERGDYLRAEADFTKAIRLDPDSVEGLLGRARAFEALGKAVAARHDRRAASALAKALYSTSGSEDSDVDAADDDDEPRLGAGNSSDSFISLSSTASFAADHLHAGYTAGAAQMAAAERKERVDRSEADKSMPADGGRAPIEKATVVPAVAVDALEDAGIPAYARKVENAEISEMLMVLEEEGSSLLDLPDVAEQLAAFDAQDSTGHGVLALAEIRQAVQRLFPQVHHIPALMLAYRAVDEKSDGWIGRQAFSMLLHYLSYFVAAWDILLELEQKYCASDGSRILSKKGWSACADRLGLPGRISAAAFEHYTSALPSAPRNDGGSYASFDALCCWAGSVAVAAMDQPLVSEINGKNINGHDNEDSGDAVGYETDDGPIISPTVSPSSPIGQGQMIPLGASLSGEDGPKLDELSGCWAWGRNHRGQLGVGFWGSSRRLPSRPIGLPESVPRTPVPRRIKLASCGANHTVLVTESGEVWAFGANDVDQLGLGLLDRATAMKSGTAAKPRLTGGHAKDTEHFVVPQRVRGLLPAVQTGVRDLACGENHTVLLTGRGEVWLWGDNQKSQLGLPTHHKTMSLAVPVRLDDLQDDPCIAVAAGRHHSAAISALGELFTWGDNTYGQLGLEDVGGHPQPVSQVGGKIVGKRVVLVACGERHTLCAAQTGMDVVSAGERFVAAGGVWGPQQFAKAYAWGNNEYGQLGLGLRRGEIGYLPNVAQPEPIVFSSYRTFARDVHLYDSSDQKRPSGPVRPKTPGKSRSRGTGNKTNSSAKGAKWAPSAAVGAAAVDSGLISVVQLSAGGRHSAAVVERLIEGDATAQVGASVEHGLWTWGMNDKGQLGLGDSRNQLLAANDRGAASSRNMEAPQYVAGRWLDGPVGRRRPKPVVACGLSTTYLTVGGDVYSWGGNHNGQLGYNIAVDSVPARPATQADRTNMVKRSTAAPNLVAISDNNSDDDPVDVPLCAATGPNAQHMFVWPDIAGSTYDGRRLRELPAYEKCEAAIDSFDLAALTDCLDMATQDPETVPLVKALQIRRKQIQQYWGSSDSLDSAKGLRARELLLSLEERQAAAAQRIEALAVFQQARQPIPKHQVASGRTRHKAQPKPAPRKSLSSNTRQYPGAALPTTRLPDRLAPPSPGSNKTRSHTWRPLAAKPPPPPRVAGGISDERAGASDTGHSAPSLGTESEADARRRRQMRPLSADAEARLYRHTAGQRVSLTTRAQAQQTGRQASQTNSPKRSAHSRSPQDQSVMANKPHAPMSPSVVVAKVTKVPNVPEQEKRVEHLEAELIDLRSGVGVLRNEINTSFTELRERMQSMSTQLAALLSVSAGPDNA